MRELIVLLRLAYSAENAARLAYLGHARSLTDDGERAEIIRIMQEEVLHREQVGALLRELGIAPSRYLELKFRLIGTVIGSSCHVIGWFMPMYFAGRLESGNVNEYLVMEELMRGTPLDRHRACVLEMARVEKEHEVYFLDRIRDHRLARVFQRVFGWGPDRSFNACAHLVRPETER